MPHSQTLRSGSFPPLTVLFLLLLILVSLILRWQITVVKPFDPDELAQLHTSWLITHGSLPYRDFFTGYPPTFPLFLGPLFLLPPSDFLLIVVRQLFFVISLTTFFLIYKIARLAMNRTFSLIAILFLATSVFFIERGVEIRPDTFVLFLWILSAFILSRPAEKLKPIHLILIGFTTGLSLAITQKAAYGLLFITVLLAYRFFFLIKKRQLKQLAQKILLVVIPAAIPLLALVTYLWSNHILSLAMTYTIKVPLSLNNLYHWEHPWYHLGFFPDFTHYIYFEYFYKSSIIWLRESQITWVLTFLLLPVWLIPRLRSFKRRALPESPDYRYFIVFLTSGFFIFLAYLLLLSLKIPQYWIFLAPFACLALTFGLYEVGQKSPGLKIPIVVVTLIGVTLTAANLIQTWESDLSWNTNTKQLRDIRAVLALTPPTARGYDGVGSYIFRPDCYYFSLNLPTEIPPQYFYDIIVDFYKGKCDFILEGLFNRMDSWNKDENDFVNQNYVPAPQFPDLFLRKPI